jgi:LysM repeat protein
MSGKSRILFSMAVVLVLLLSLNVTPASAGIETNYVTYVVQKGDTLGGIASKYCTTWQAIYDINKDTIGSNPNRIETGMVLTIPANCIPPVPAATPVPGSANCDKGPITHATGTYSVPYYTVAWGDTLSSIGVRFCIPWQDIAKANGITGTSVFAGQVLFIPNGTVTSPPPQQGTTERVYFQSGATSASRSGVISQGQPKSYILWANAGQTMSVTTSSSGEPLVISIGNTRGDLLPLSGTNSQINNNVWTVLPASGDYIVTVRPVTPPESPELTFSINFTIK